MITKKQLTIARPMRHRDRLESDHSATDLHPMNSVFGRKRIRLFLLVLVAFVASLPLGGNVCGQPSHGLNTAAAPPNVLIFLADDLGYSDLGCYGGEIATPNLDRLASGGLRFSQFYNTARCWPSRAAILTGYYPQQIRMDPPRGRLPSWASTLPQYLRRAGYRSYHSGKWHINGAPRPVADGGFDRSYNLPDQDRHFSPQQHQLDDQPLPEIERSAGYYATTAIADHAIECLRDHAHNFGGQPFFQYVAFTVPHFPLMAPQEDVERYRETYTSGWKNIRQQRLQRQQQQGMWRVMAADPESQIKAPSGRADTLDHLGAAEVLYAVDWESLTVEQQQFQSIKMAIHAAMIDRMDQEIGRILNQLRAMNALENTLILFLSDNGASAEILVRGDGHDANAMPGSAASYLCLGPGWSTTCNTPFRRHKIWVHEGGIATPLIIHWPDGIAQVGGWRHDVGHVIDLLPTVLQLAGVEWTTFKDGQPPFPGISLVAALPGGEPQPRESLYFSHSGNRALRTENYKLVSARNEQDRWELYNMDNDRGEVHDLASEQPEQVAKMAARWQELDDLFKHQAAEDIGDDE